MPAIGLDGQPREVTGTVRLICDGRFRNDGPMARGVQMDMGPTAVLDTGKVEIVVISRHVEPNDLACLHSRRHRSGAQALRDAEEPHPLARRLRGRSRRPSSSAPAPASARRTTRRCSSRTCARPIYPLDPM